MERRFVEPRACRELLEKLLTEEVGALTRLEGLLDREHEYLVANNIDAFERAGEERQNCVGVLVRVEDERRSLCRMMNLPADPAGLEKLIGWCDSSGALKKRWAACADRAIGCRGRNDRNGALVTSRLKRVEGMLNVITGRSKQPKVYGRQGGYAVSGRSEHVIATV
jgi:flagellar biosynthesis/type III secretory pathway chaperone